MYFNTTSFLISLTGERNLYLTGLKQSTSSNYCLWKSSVKSYFPWPPGNGTSLLSPCCWPLCTVLWESHTLGWNSTSLFWLREFLSDKRLSKATVLGPVPGYSLEGVPGTVRDCHEAIQLLMRHSVRVPLPRGELFFQHSQRGYLWPEALSQ